MIFGYTESMDFHPDFHFHPDFRGLFARIREAFAGMKPSSGLSGFTVMRIVAGMMFLALLAGFLCHALLSKK